MLERILKRADLWDVTLVLIAAAAIIGVWRGIWNLLDAYLLPDNFLLSQAVSIIVGVLVLAMLSRYR